MSKKNKVTTCKHCGNVIASDAKVCPNCGGKNKKPFYKRAWFIIVIVIIIIGVIGSLGGNNSEEDNSNLSIPTENGGDIQSESQNEEIIYTSYDVSELMDDLDSNALKASEKYKDQYVELTGKLNVIDSDGKYISIVPTGDDFAIIGVQCYIKTEDQKSAIMDMEIGDTLIVKGKIKDVGEVLGYYLDIDSVEKLEG